MEVAPALPFNDAEEGTPTAEVGAIEAGSEDLPAGISTPAPDVAPNSNAHRSALYSEGTKCGNAEEIEDFAQPDSTSGFAPEAQRSARAQQHASGTPRRSSNVPLGNASMPSPHDHARGAFSPGSLKVKFGRAPQAAGRHRPLEDYGPPSPLMGSPVSTPTGKRGRGTPMQYHPYAHAI